MKLTLYDSDLDIPNDVYHEYCEIIGYHHYFHQYCNLTTYPEFDLGLTEIQPDHPFVYGWLEDLFQGKRSDFFSEMNFKRIKIEK
jgi:hypothetical protein